MPHKLNQRRSIPALSGFLLSTHQNWMVERKKQVIGYHGFDDIHCILMSVIVFGAYDYGMD